MASPALPPAPGSERRTVADHLADLSDRVGTSVASLVAGTAVVAVAAVVIAAWWLAEDRSPPELSIPYAADPDPAATAPTATTLPADVLVHAAGAVTHPGVYALAPGARVGDVLAAAGGPTEGADLDRLNLAAEVVDGSRVYVPLAGEEGVPSVVGPDQAADPTGDGVAGTQVDVNRAGVDQLETLPGIGPATAAAIVAHREEHGPFASVEDLLDVRGIGEAKLDALRDLVVVGS